MSDSKSVEVWIKLEGPLSVPLDPPSRWAIGALQPHAQEVIALAREVANGAVLIVYAEAAASIKGQRAVQRWLISNDIDAWVTHVQEPPQGVERIESWQTSTTSDSPAAHP